MSAVEGRYTGLVEPLGDCDDTGVGTAEGKVDVLFDEIGDTVQIGPGQRLDHHIALRDRSEERRFCSGPELSCNQVRGLGDDEMARDKLIGRLNDFDAGDVVGVSVVRCGEKDSGVNNEHDQSRPNPSANISSASRAPRPDVDEPIPTNASLRRGAAAPSGKLAAISAMSWSRVIPRRFDSAWRRAWASAGRSSVTVMGPMLERNGDTRTGQQDCPCG